MAEDAGAARRRARGAEEAMVGRLCHLRRIARELGLDRDRPVTAAAGRGEEEDERADHDRAGSCG